MGINLAANQRFNPSYDMPKRRQMEGEITAWVRFSKEFYCDQFKMLKTNTFDTKNERLEPIPDAEKVGSSLPCYLTGL